MNYRYKRIYKEKSCSLIAGWYQSIFQQGYPSASFDVSFETNTTGSVLHILSSLPTSSIDVDLQGFSDFVLNTPMLSSSVSFDDIDNIKFEKSQYPIEQINTFESGTFEKNFLSIGYATNDNITKKNKEVFIAETLYQSIEQNHDKRFPSGYVDINMYNNTASVDFCFESCSNIEQHISESVEIAEGVFDINISTTNYIQFIEEDSYNNKSEYQIDLYGTYIQPDSYYIGGKSNNHIDFLSSIVTRKMAVEKLVSASADEVYVYLNFSKGSSTPDFGKYIVDGTEEYFDVSNFTKEYMIQTYNVINNSFVYSQNTQFLQ